MEKLTEKEAQNRTALVLSAVVLVEGALAVALAWWWAGTPGVWGALLGCLGLVLLTVSTIFELSALANHSTYMLSIALFAFLFKMVMVLLIGVISRGIPICSKCAMIVIAVGVLSSLVAEAVALIKYYPSTLEIEQ